jgi:hypothetical protein
MKKLPVALCLFMSLAAVATAQQPADRLAPQREAMSKLSFLTGHWEGPAAISRGPGGPTSYTQTENVEYKLGGLVLLIEGATRDQAGTVVFSALATIAYDDASHTYRFRAYNDGRYLDTELSVLPKGFSWSYYAGPAHIVNTMHINEAGKWAETTTAAVNGGQPRPSVDLLLTHDSAQ